MFDFFILLLLGLSLPFITYQKSQDFQLDHHVLKGFKDKISRGDLLDPTETHLSKDSPVEIGYFGPIPTGQQAPFSEQVRNLTEIDYYKSGTGKRGTCWEDSPHSIPSSSAYLSNPPTSFRVCKLFVHYDDGTNTVCSGSLVGPHILVTARHCTYHPCRGSAETVRVACGYGNGHEYLGTAYGISYFYHTGYANSIICDTIDNELQVLNHTEWLNTDIQLIRLDRSVGDVSTNGYFLIATDLEVNDDLIAYGYPGYNSDLESYIPQHSENQLGHQVTCSSTTTKVSYFDNAYLWGGESGCPYIEDSTYVACVHHGGCTGIQEICRKIDVYWGLYIQDARGEGSGIYGPTWDIPENYCQVIHYVDDFLDIIFDPNGIGAGSWSTSGNVTRGDYASIKITLFNSGTLDASNVDLRIVASSNMKFSSSDIELDVSIFSSFSWSLHQYLESFPINLKAGTYNIGAYWTANGCLENDPQEAFIGTLTVSSGSTRQPFYMRWFY